VDGVPVVKVPELLAIARGGLLLAEQARVAPRPREAIVVSCGTGTAMIAARLAGATHSGGTGVGGGTLQGLGSLMLGTRSVHDIDRLAQAGETTRVDSTLLEVLGSGFGQLPADATAVNFGKLARESALDPTREDIAAALVTMIAQTVALIAIQCARREALDTVIMVGHLAGLPSVSAQLFRTASFYGANFVVPAQGGYATLLGALAAAQIGDDVVPAL
jgi:type II pantothenate kinase